MCIACFVCSVHENRTIECVEVGMEGGGERGVFCNTNMKVQQVQYKCSAV